MGQESGTKTDSDLPDDELCAMLDRYLDAVHADDFESRSVLLEAHPEFQRLLNCLESLDSLAEPLGLDVEGNERDPISKSHSPTPVGSAAEIAAASDVMLPPTEQGLDDPPEMFGKYELVREIGRGGMGVVYLARQTDLDRTVALKMILSSRLSSPDDIRRFESEAKAAGRVHHPGIVGVHEAGQIRGQHFFAMDYVDGPSLAEVMEEGPMDADRAAECLAAVARAVQYLHEHQIVHRDLKPSNILLDESGLPHVTDFGLVKVFGGDSEATRTGLIVGTPSYMAPEQAAGRNSEITAQTDVYGMGAVLYALLLGRPPFQQDNPLDTLVDVLESEPTLPRIVNATIPRELELIAMKCLEKDPAQRYATAAELEDDLERFLKREPVVARPRGVWHVIRRWARREPALVYRLAGLAAAAFIVQMAYFYNRLFDMRGHSPVYHLKIMSVFACWAAVSFLFQKMLNRDETSNVARFGWAASDTLLLTSELYLADSPLGPLLIGYPLLIAASGLFFRVRLIVFTTTAVVLAYAILMFLRPSEASPVHYPLIFAATAIVIGFMVGYQVHRVRALSRYYERRRVL